MEISIQLAGSGRYFLKSNLYTFVLRRNVRPNHVPDRHLGDMSPVNMSAR